VGWEVVFLGSCSVNCDCEGAGFGLAMKCALCVALCDARMWQCLMHCVLHCVRLALGSSATAQAMSPTARCRCSRRLRQVGRSVLDVLLTEPWLCCVTVQMRCVAGHWIMHCLMHARVPLAT
jgi:hypothetical protein